MSTIPSCSPSSPIRRTSGTRIRSLIRVVSRSGGRRSNLRGIGTMRRAGQSSKAERRAKSGGHGRGSASLARDLGALHSPASIAAAERRSTRLSACLYLVSGTRAELVDRHVADVALAMAADCDAAGVLLLVAHDEHVRRLVDLRVADLPADRLGSFVYLGAHTGRPQLRGDPLPVLHVTVGDGQHERLDRGEPERELAGVVL